MFTLIAIRGT